MINFSAWKINETPYPLTLSSKEHKKEAIAISLPQMMGHRIRYSHISSIAGVMTQWRKSEHGNIMDQSFNRKMVFKDGQLLFPMRMDQIHKR